MTLQLGYFLNLPVHFPESAANEQNFLAITAWNYPCKRLNVMFGYFTFQRKLHLDFRNSLLKYAQNNRKHHRSDITRITVD